MSVVYEPRNIFHDGGYPPMDDHHDPNPDADRFADPGDSVVGALAGVAEYNGPGPAFDTPEPPRLDLGSSTLAKEDSPTVTTPSRIKAIPKPDREITKNADGKYVCTYPGCSEDVKEFGRKCEWSKHMDKHDRPYKCAAEGCEKLAGFTYSGGLLRHEREVHGKHGGPKNSFNCPHPNCKRHTGKGFSRLENLNEHLRRVHTQNGAPNGTEGETDDAASDAATGQKRKRESEEGSDDLREELKRVRRENEELKKQVAAQDAQTAGLLQQISQLTGGALGQPRMAPTAPMSASAMI